MKAKIITLTIAALISTPVFAQQNQAQAFERQMFATQTPINAIELSEAEMHGTEGAVAPVVWAAVTVIIRGVQVYQKGRKLSQAQAIAALKRGESVITNSQRYSGQLAKTAWGKRNVIQHGAHKPHRGFLPHYQSNKVRGAHAFWSK